MTSTPPPPTPASTAPAPPPAAPTAGGDSKRSSALDDYYHKWEQKVAGMKQASAAVDWSGTDWSKLKPSDIGVHIGPLMTEEQFREYRKRTGGNPTVLKAPTNPATNPATNPMSSAQKLGGTNNKPK